jgi:sirohydrochlorin ferrochelatase
MKRKTYSIGLSARSAYWGILCVPAFCLFAVTAILLAGGGCDFPASGGSGRTSDPGVKTGAALPRDEKVAVLLVSHGSHSAQWREMLHEVERDVAERVLAIPGIVGIKSAFMEYTEPSIASQLKALDDEGYTQVILVPLLLTVSGHSFDDIPTIIGAKDDAKSLAMLEAEGIERYLPRAKVTITPLLDFSSLLEKNLARRVTRLTKEPANEGVVLVAYGDAEYNDEWIALFREVGEKIKAETGVTAVTHAWCGHIAGYKKEPTIEAIRSILAEHERAIIMPVLVAYDETFQSKIIGGAVEKVGDEDRVVYTPDAILPEPALNDWIVTISKETRESLDRRSAKESRP